METNNKDWNQPGTWAEELVEQAKNNAKRWFRTWVITFVCLLIVAGAFIGTNIYWIHVFQSYDYVNQDGTGINSINTGHQEDIQYHVTEGENEEKSQEE